MKKKLVLGFLILSVIACNTQRSVNDEEAITPSNNNSILDWHEQKFSMFIHFGIYSIPAGFWNGEKIDGYAEQIQALAFIPSEEYRPLAKEFNPTLWDSDSIALLAKEAEMKSIVITAKHHDGFSIFDTKYSEFDVVDATPYEKDIIKDLSDACKRHGLKFGVYFSLIDWDYPGATPFTSDMNNDPVPPVHHQYNLNQVEELLTNYGDISEIWFDMSAQTYEQSKQLRDLVKRIQPNCQISGRIWNNQGDFVVLGDNDLPKIKMGVPWQTPASIFEDTWGYRSWMERTDLNEKIKEKIHHLIYVTSLGGNYLLNIGPKDDGSVVPYEKNVLLGIGKWLKVNGEAIYRTNSTEMSIQDWGYITNKNNKLYLMITNYPQDDKLHIQGLDVKVKKIYPLANNTIFLESTSINENFEITLRDKIEKDNYATVIVLEYDHFYYTPSNLIDISEEGAFLLSEDNAVNYYSYSIGDDYYTYEPTIIKMEWNLSGISKEVGEVTIVYSPEIDIPQKLYVNDKNYDISFKSSEERQYIEQTFSNVHFDPDNFNKVKIIMEDIRIPHNGLDIKDIKIEFN